MIDQFPILASAEARPPKYPHWVPFVFIEKYAANIVRNHGQTVARIAVRGGLSWAELWVAVESRPLGDVWHTTDTEAAAAVMARIEQDGWTLDDNREWLPANGESV